MEQITLGAHGPAKPKGEDATLGELFTSARDDALKASNLNAYTTNLADAYDQVNDRVKQATGMDVVNPMRVTVKAPKFGELDAENPHAAWANTLKDLQTKHADALPWDDLLTEPQKQAYSRMQAARTANAEMTERAGMYQAGDIPLVGGLPLVGDAAALIANIATKPLATGAQFAGGFYGQMQSPVDAAANLAGFTVGGAAKSLLKNAVYNALTNAAVQAPLSALKQDDYKNAGLPYGWQAWMQEVQGAAATGFGLDLAIRGPSRAILSRYGRDVAPGEFASKNTARGGFLTDAIEQTPVIKAPKVDIDPETIKRAEAGDVAASREILEKTGATEDPSVRGILNAMEMGKLTDEQLARLEAMGVARSDGVRMVADALQGKPIDIPEPIRAGTQLVPEDGQALIQKHGEDLRRGLAPQIAQAVEDGLEAGIPAIVEAVRAAGGDPAKLTLTPEAIATARLHSGRMQPMEIAATIRSNPDLIDASMPLDTGRMRVARSIARLDDVAFEKAGNVPPEVAALVSERVPLLDQARVIADLERLRPADLAEATRLVDQLAPLQQSPQQSPQKSLQGLTAVDDPSNAKAQIEALKQEAGQPLADAMAPIERRKELESKVETLKGEIAKLEDAASRDAMSEQYQDLQDYADPVTGEVMQRGDVESIVDMWRFVQDMRKAKKPQTLSQWVVRTGRVQDQNGELTNILGGRARHLISGKGRTLDDAARAAWEDGYFPSAERPTVREFLDAIDEDVRDSSRTRVADANIAEDFAVAREMETELGKLGIDGAKTETDVRAYFARQSGEGARGDQAVAAKQGDAAEADLDRSLWSLRDDSLDMGDPARKDRARSLGFDVDTVWYHGTPDSRGIWKEGFKTLIERYGSDNPERIFFFAKEQRVARTYADDSRAFDYQNSEPEVIPVYVRPGKVKTIEWGGRTFRNREGDGRPFAIRDEINKARTEGFDSVVIKDVVDTYNATGKPSTIVAMFAPEDIRSVKAAFDPAKSSSSNLMFALSSRQLAELGAKKLELRRAEKELLEAAREANPTPDGEALYRLAKRALDMRREMDVVTGVRQALLLARRMLPDAVKIDVLPDEDMIYRMANGDTAQLDASSNQKTGHIQLALHALDPSAKIGHEAVHTLVTLGHLSPAEVEALATLAREAKTFTKEDQYRKAYADRENLDALVNEEAAASYIEARIKGDVKGPENTTVNRIKQLIERIKQALAGYGFKSKEDIVQALMRGDVAKREARADWMRNAPETEGERLASLSDRDTGQSMRRDLDSLGYYSKALEAARSLKQAKGTPEQMLAQLKAAGVKQAELDAVNIAALLDGKSSITRDEIIKHISDNGIGLREVQRFTDRELAQQRGKEYDRMRPDERDMLGMSEQIVKWRNYSLDPKNQTYRETVLHLPSTLKRHDRETYKKLSRLQREMESANARLDYDAADSIMAEIEAIDPRYLELKSQHAEDFAPTDFQSGHFSEPNIIGHMMTSMVKHEGKPTFLIDQIQSDWGQKIRDQGGPAEDRSKKIDAVKDQLEAIGLSPAAKMYIASQHGHLNIAMAAAVSNLKVDDPVRIELRALTPETRQDYYRLTAELKTLEQSGVAGHPLVNTTDQWTNTTLRRAIRQAAEADAEFIAIPAGKTVESYNPQGDSEGNAVFYEKIVPKNLRNLLQKIDKASPAPIRVETLDSPSGETGLGEGFSLFPLTPEVKRSVLEDGQQLFALADRDLDLSLDARKKRAENMGFDTGTTWFHGTREQFDAFDLATIGDNFRADERGFFFINDPKQAGEYATSDSVGMPASGGSVIPSYLRMNRPLIIDDARLKKEGMQPIGKTEDVVSFWDNYQGQILEWVDAEKADGVVLVDNSYRQKTMNKGQPTMMAVVFDPANIRSVNAEFDPAQSGSSRLLASLSDRPVEPPLKADMAFVDRLETFKSLIEACRA